jgi:(p)ppGpp synthase/HD superfamily hydrolase
MIIMLSVAAHIAGKAHAGQYRNDGITPFITHAIRLAGKQRDAIRKAAAYVHDVLEDSEYTEEYLRSKLPDEVVDIVVILTRREDETYMDYIRRVKASGNQAAIGLKIDDIEDNMSDGPLGTMGERYERALKILR